MTYYDHDGILVRDARQEDVTALKDRLRSEDVKEILAAGNDSAESALAQSLSRSTFSFTIELAGVPVGMFGVVPETILGQTACIWFLGAPEMAKIKKTFVKLSRAFIAYFLSQYPALWNVVDARYTASIKWLESCGAVFDDYPLIFNGVDFYRFVFRRPT